MEEVITERRSSLEGEEEIVQSGKEQHQSDEAHVLQFLDSLDSYLTLFDSLSSTLRQGWLELASARHSMGSSRINGSLLDLKPHSAATTLQVTDHNVDSEVAQGCFKLHKWTTNDDGENVKKEDNLKLRHRGTSENSETASVANKNVDELTVDKVQRERAKNLSVFGSLVSPKLRASQLSFERALELLVEIANKRSLVLASFDQLILESDHTK